MVRKNAGYDDPRYNLLSNRSNGCFSNFMIAAKLIYFCLLFKKVIYIEHLRRPFLYHCINLWQFGCIETKCIEDCMQIIDDYAYKQSHSYSQTQTQPKTEIQTEIQTEILTEMHKQTDTETEAQKTENQIKIENQAFIENDIENIDKTQQNETTDYLQQLKQETVDEIIKLENNSINMNDSNKYNEMNTDNQEIINENQNNNDSFSKNKYDFDFMQHIDLNDTEIYLSNNNNHRLPKQYQFKIYTGSNASPEKSLSVSLSPGPPNL